MAFVLNRHTEHGYLGIEYSLIKTSFWMSATILNYSLHLLIITLQCLAPPDYLH